MWRLRTWVLGAACSSCGAPEVPQGVASEVTTSAPSVRLGFDGCERIVAQKICQRRGGGPLEVWLPGDFSVGRVTVWRGEQVVDDGAPVAHDGGVLLSLPWADVGHYSVLDGDRHVADFDIEATPWSHRLVEYVTFEVHGWGRGQAYTEAVLDITGAVLGGASVPSVVCFKAKVAYTSEDWSGVLSYADALERLTAGGGDAICTATAHIQAAQAATEHQPDFDRAARHIRLAASYTEDLRTRAYADYFRGVLAQYAGDLDEAIAWFERALSQSRRIDDRIASDDYRAQQVVLLSRLGRYEEARAVAARIEGGTPSHAMSVIWAEILEREEDPRVPSPRARLEQFVDSLAENPSSYRYHNALVNLAIVAAQDGDFAAAERSMERVDPSLLTSEAVVFAHITRARTALAGGRSDAALEELARARERAADDPDPELVLRTTLVEAQMQQALDHPEAALALYERADELEEQLAVGIAPQAGRSMFSRTWRRSRARRLRLLLEQGHQARALCVVLASRARYLRSLMVDSARESERTREQRKALSFERTQLRGRIAALAAGRWRLAQDERQDLDARLVGMRREHQALSDRIVALVEGSGATPPWSCDDVRSDDDARVLVTMHPSDESGRWWIFIERAGELAVTSVEVPDGLGARGKGKLVEQALRSLDAAAPQLVIVPLGGFNEVEIDSRALGELGVTSVVYSLGLGRGAGEAEPATAGAGVVAVGRVDDLRLAAAEAEDVTTRLRADGWTVASVWNEADPELRPTLLHYAGHASHEGVNGWSSQLLLGDRELSIGDLIAVERPPSVVVLGACEAAANDPRALDGGINVASAFLLAGSSAVLAPTVRVDDEVARDFARWVYSTSSVPPHEGAIIRALRETVFEADAHDPAFAPWRLLVR